MHVKTVIFDVCVLCTFGQKVLPHEGHKDHALKLQREAFFKCDACSEEAKDYSYVCSAPPATFGSTGNVL